MVSVQSFIRAEVSCGAFPAPSGAEAYSEYAIASAKDLIPEMENAARQTLDHTLASVTTIMTSAVDTVLIKMSSFYEEIIE
jgi:hypothetical protein